MQKWIGRNNLGTSQCGKASPEGPGYTVPIWLQVSIPTTNLHTCKTPVHIAQLLLTLVLNTYPLSFEEPELESNFKVHLLDETLI